MSYYTPANPRGCGRLPGLGSWQLDNWMFGKRIPGSQMEIQITLHVLRENVMALSQQAFPMPCVITVSKWFNDLLELSMSWSLGTFQMRCPQIF